MTTTLDPAKEEGACALCGKRRASPLFVIRGFQFWRCQACKTQFVSPRLKFSNLLNLYDQKDYFKSDNSLVHGYTDYVSDKPNIIATFEKRYAWMSRQTGDLRSGRLLDVGCAAGFSVEVALSRGWDAYGLEPSGYAASVAREKWGDRIIHGTLDQNPFAPGSFQMVLLWDVIEHVPSPLETLRQVYDLLAPGGWISLITPDCGSVVARLMGQRWMEYAKPDEHIHFFSRSTISEALKRTGFRPGGVTSAGKYVGVDFLADRLAGHFPSLQFLKTRAQQAGPAWRVYINPGDKLFVVAQKPVV